MNPYESKFILSDKKVKVIINILGLIAIMIIGVFSTMQNLMLALKLLLILNHLRHGEK